MQSNDSDDCEDRRARFAAEAREERPDLAELCLLLCAEAEPGFGRDRMDAAEIELDRLAGLVPYGAKSPQDWARALEQLLGGGHGFHGTPADYRRLESSLLHQVLLRRRGCPSHSRWCGWRSRGGRGRRCTGWRCRGTSWSASGTRPSRCWPTRSPAGAS